MITPSARAAQAERDTDQRIARLEWGISLLAYIVVRHGEVYGPLLDRLEEELEIARRSVSYRARARRILASQIKEVRNASEK